MDFGLLGASPRARRGALAVAAAIAAATLTAAPASASESGPAVTTFTLENGMQGVVIEDRRAPVATHMVWYRVGSADEPAGQSGIAHFLEHLMFKGTDDLAPGEFSRTVAQNGGQDNAFTSLDYTAYHQRIAADRVELVMSMEADRMRDLRLDPAEVDAERDVVIEERNSRTDTNPQAQFFEQLNASLFLNHRYGVPIIGWRHEIEALSREDALAFYERFYGPDNAILVVAGDVDPEAIQEMAERHFGPIEAAGITAYDRPVEPPQRAERRISMADANVRQPFFLRATIAPSYVTAEPGRAEALALAAEILGGGPTARLSRALVLEQQIALDAGAYYRGVSRDDTSFNLYGVPKEGETLETVEAAADAVIAQLIADGPTEAELERAKMVLISSSIYRQDDQARMARLYGSALTIGLTVEDVQDWPDRIRAVTAEDVVEALAGLDRRASVTGYLTGEPAPTDSERAEVQE